MAENQRELRHKRKIIGEIRQITRAMKLVSGAKLRRTEAKREAGEVYWSQLRETLALLGQRMPAAVRHPYLGQREVKAVAVLILAGDKGLCGAFNANIVSAATEYVRSIAAPAQVTTVGARTADMARRAGLNITERFPAVHEKQAWQDALHITRHLEQLYRSGSVDRVCVAYARFVSTVSHEPAVETLLPLEPPAAAETWGQRYIFEPESEELFVRLLPRFLRCRLYRLLLASAASEHSARLMAMTAATDNADDMIEQLTRRINRARQQEITRELLDVVSGADALAHEA